MEEMRDHCGLLENLVVRVDVLSYGTNDMHNARLLSFYLIIQDILL